MMTPYEEQQRGGRLGETVVRILNVEKSPSGLCVEDAVRVMTAGSCNTVRTELSNRAATVPEKSGRGR